MAKVPMNSTTLEQLLREWALDARAPDEATLRLANIDSNITKADMMRWIDDSGFAGTYDYFYLPRRFDHRQNSGYAFVNFTTKEASQAFVMAVSEQRVQCQVAYVLKMADLQGLEENLALWARACVRRIRDPEALPFVRSLNESGVHHPALAVQLRAVCSPGGRSTADSPAAAPPAEAAGSPSSATANFPRCRSGRSGSSSVKGARPTPSSNEGAAPVRAAQSHGWEESAASAASTSVRRTNDQLQLCTQPLDDSGRLHSAQACDENVASWHRMHDPVASPLLLPPGDWGAFADVSRVRDRYGLPRMQPLDDNDVFHHARAMQYSSAREDRLVTNASRAEPAGVSASSSCSLQLPWRQSSSIGGASSSTASSYLPYHMSGNVGREGQKTGQEPTYGCRFPRATAQGFDSLADAAPAPNSGAAVFCAGREVLWRKSL